jgi:L-rhamnose isomerase
MGPRQRYADSIDQVLACGYDKSKVYVTVESKVFGIGVEAYTVGSGEFSLCYAISRGITPLMDNGHYHPTEVVSDKIPALLCFSDKIALHITRPIRWDSDHVVLLDDETKELCKEIVRCGIDKVFIALDYFDASINRISAWVTGFRNLQKALLFGMLQPQEELTKLQNEGNWTKLMVIQEELKTMPFGEIWEEYCRVCDVPGDGRWFETVKKYEAEVLRKRG